MTRRSVERLLDDLRTLAQGCLTIERLLHADTTTAPSHERDEPLAGHIDGASGDTSDSIVLRDLAPEAHRLCALARELRECCGRVTANLSKDISVSGDGESRRHTILAVDDTDDTRQLLSDILDSAGFDVVTATNGLEALIAAHQTRPSLILMDLQMPILDGIEATRLLKATEATKHIPVIAHTARPSSCHVPPGVLFAHILPKPVFPDVLLALTHRFLRNGHGAT